MPDKHPFRYTVHHRENCHQGFFRLDRYRVSHSLYAGGESPVLTRELFERGEAVAILLFDARRDRVVLVEQFRVGAIRDPGGAWLLEVVAGIFDEGETAEDVARRESMEEAGCTVGRVEPICRFYVSPGGTTEIIHLLCGEVDSEGVGGVHGLPEEGEDIAVHVVATATALEWIASGRICSANPIIALQWLALNHQRLLSEWR